MAADGQIRVVLTLDDTGFSVKTRRAAEVTEQLKKSFSGATSASKGMETELQSVSRIAEGIAATVKRLDVTLTSLAKGFTQVAQRLGLVATNARKTGTAMESLKASLQQAAQGHKTLQSEQARTSAGLQQMTRAVQLSKSETLRIEQEKNAQLLASKRRVIQQLIALEESYRAQSAASLAKAAAAEKRLGAYGGKNVIATNFNEAMRQQAWATATQQQIQALSRQTQALATRNREIAQGLPLLLRQEAAERAAGRAATETAAKIAQAAQQQRQAAQQLAADVRRHAMDRARAEKQASQEAVRAAREAVQERKRLAREAANFEREQANQVAALWTSMAQLWASHKIRQGFGALTRSASRAQQVDLQVSAFNLPSDQQTYFDRMASELAEQTKYLSSIDAREGRLQAIASMSKNNAAAIDKTLPVAMKTIEALRRMGMGTGDPISTQRNLYGLAEMRQVVNDATRTIGTFDTAYRAIVASKGKITLADIETVMRTLGGQSAQLISDEGMLRMAALMDQMKVSGGHGAGGGGGGLGSGVQTVGTAIKMLQLYGVGKGMSKEAIRQFLEAGVLDVDAIPGTKRWKEGKAERDVLMSGTKGKKQLRYAGLKGADLLMQDPLKYLELIREPILEFMKKNPATYFQGADMNDPGAQNTAFTKFFSRTGVSRHAVSGFTTGTNPVFIERAKGNVAQAQNAKDADTILKESDENWSAATEHMKKAVEELGVAFEPTLKSLGKILHVIADIMEAGARFFKENPIAATATATTAAFVGANMAMRGMLGMFGKVGTLSTVAGTLGRNMLGLSANTTAAATATAALGQRATGASAQVGGLTTATTALTRAQLAATQAAYQESLLLQRQAAQRLAAAQATVRQTTGFARLSAVQNTLLPAQRNMATATANLVRSQNALGAAVVQNSQRMTTGAARVSALGAAFAGVASKTKTLGAGLVNFVGGPLAAVAVGIVALIALWDKYGDAMTRAWKKSAKEARESLKTEEDRYIELANKRLPQEEQIQGEIEQQKTKLEKMQATLKEKEVELAALENFLATSLSRRARRARDRETGSLRERIETLRQEVRDREQELAYAARNEKMLEEDRATAAKEREKRDKETQDLLKQIQDAGNQNFGDDDNGRYRRQFENAFQGQLAQIERQVTLLRTKKDLILDENAEYLEKLEAQAREEAELLWEGGKFDDGGDPQKRKFTKVPYSKNRGFTRADIDWTMPDPQTGKTMTDMKNLLLEYRRLQDEKTALVAVNKRLIASEESVTEASERLTAGGIVKQSEAMRALRAEFAQFVKANPILQDSAEFQSMMAQTMLNRAREEMNNFGLDMIAKTREINAALKQSTTGAMLAEHEVAREQLREAFQVEEEKQEAHRNTVLKYIEGLDTMSKAYKDAMADLEKFDAARAERKAAHDKEMEEKAPKAVRALMKEWGDHYQQLTQLEAQWVSSFSDAMHQLITTGEADWRSFIASILSDLAKLAMNKAFSSLFSDLLGNDEGGTRTGLSGLISNLIFGSKESGQQTGAAGYSGGFTGVLGAGVSYLTGQSSAGAASNGAAQAAGSLIGGAAFGGGGAGAAAGSEGASILDSSLTSLGAKFNTMGETTLSLNDAMMSGKSAMSLLNTTTEASTLATQTNTLMCGEETAAIAGATIATITDTGVTEAGTIITELAGTAKSSAETPAVFEATAAAISLAAALEAAAIASSVSYAAKGGIMTSDGMLDLSKYARGGVAKSAQIAVFGEGSMNEAYVPLPDGRSIPVTLRTESSAVETLETSGPDNMVNISIIINKGDGGDSETSRTQGEDPELWKKMANRIKGIVTETLLTEKRPGGILAG
jgi:hypothetical protein